MLLLKTFCYFNVILHLLSHFRSTLAFATTRCYIYPFNSFFYYNVTFPVLRPTLHLHFPRDVTLYYTTYFYPFFNIYVIVQFSHVCCVHIAWQREGFSVYKWPLLWNITICIKLFLAGHITLGFFFFISIFISIESITTSCIPIGPRCNYIIMCDPFVYRISFFALSDLRSTPLAARHYFALL